MALPSSGPISGSMFQTEFGGSNPIAMSEYYRNGGLVPADITGVNPTSITGTIPTSGQIKSSDFYGTRDYGSLKIICNELYIQGFLPEHMWDVDERYGVMMWNIDRKLVIGYNIWARGVVKFMRKNPKYTKYIYIVVKPWTEYMAYKMGAMKQNNWIGSAMNFVGRHYSYYIYNSSGVAKRLDKNKANKNNILTSF